MKLIQGITNDKQHNDYLELFHESFGDAFETIETYLKGLIDPKDIWLLYDGDVLVFICSISFKKIVNLNNEILSCGVINGIATKKTYRRQHLMQTYLSKYISHYQNQVDVLAIQASNWDLYKWLNLQPCDICVQYKVIDNFKGAESSIINIEQLKAVINHPQQNQWVWLMEENEIKTLIKLVQDNHYYFYSNQGAILVLDNSGRFIYAAADEDKSLLLLIKEFGINGTIAYNFSGLNSSINATNKTVTFTKIINSNIPINVLKLIPNFL